PVIDGQIHLGVLEELPPERAKGLWDLSNAGETVYSQIGDHPADPSTDAITRDGDTRAGAEELLSGELVVSTSSREVGRKISNRDWGKTKRKEGLTLIRKPSVRLEMVGGTGMVNNREIVAAMGQRPFSQCLQRERGAPMVALARFATLTCESLRSQRDRIHQWDRLGRDVGRQLGLLALPAGPAHGDGEGGGEVRERGCLDLRLTLALTLPRSLALGKNGSSPSVFSRARWYLLFLLLLLLILLLLAPPRCTLQRQAA
ncbi:hypothetical protein B0H14DRAFT_2604760, partial [Mycena olivaceomarginata]